MTAYKLSQLLTLAYHRVGAHMVMPVVDHLHVPTHSLSAPGSFDTQLTGIRNCDVLPIDRPTFPAASPLSGPKEVTTGARGRDPLRTDSDGES